MADTLDFLLEIGCEEMPSAPLMNAAKQLPKLVQKRLDAAGLSHGAVRVVSSPRRLDAIVSDVAVATEAIDEVMRGPKAQIAFDADGNPTKAAAGFARKCGIEASELKVRTAEDGNDYVFAQKSVPIGRHAHHSPKALPWRHRRHQVAAAAPRRAGLRLRPSCAHPLDLRAPGGSEVVPVTYADVTSGNVTRGHRVLGPGEHVVADPASYESVLESACVLSAERREEVIRKGIAEVEAARPGCRVDTPKRTFDEVVNLCEWPTVLVSTFDEFLKVPQEIICESMLSTSATSRSLARAASGPTSSSSSPTPTPRSRQVVSGNEASCAPRLATTSFASSRTSSARWRSSSASGHRHLQGLGTTLQKVGRMERLAKAVAQAAGEDEQGVSNAVRAAHLAKADLVSQAVVEFTSQQGVMGGYYAEAAGEPDDVCAAIREHYRPRFAGDELPSGTCGKCVAIADNGRTACSIFAIDEPPTGGSNPYAVRRAAIGIIAMLRTMPSVHLKDLIALALSSYAEQGLEFDPAAVQADVEKFFLGRLAAIAKEEGVAPDAIEAVSSVAVIDPAEFLARAEALDAARSEQPRLFDIVARPAPRA